MKIRPKAERILSPRGVSPTSTCKLMPKARDRVDPPAESQATAVRKSLEPGPVWLLAGRLRGRLAEGGSTSTSRWHFMHCSRFVTCKPGENSIPPTERSRPALWQASSRERTSFIRTLHSHTPPLRVSSLLQAEAKTFQSGDLELCESMDPGKNCRFLNVGCDCKPGDLLRLRTGSCSSDEGDQGVIQ